MPTWVFVVYGLVMIGACVISTPQTFPEMFADHYPHLLALSIKWKWLSTTLIMLNAVFFFGAWKLWPKKPSPSPLPRSDA